MLNKVCALLLLESSLDQKDRTPALLGFKRVQRKKTFKGGRSGLTMHFLLRFKVSPAPGTAMASLDCSRILLQPVQRLSAAVRKCLREVPLNTKPRCNQTA